MSIKIVIKPSFSEKKTTQAAAFLLKLNDGKMNYMKLVKLLYNIDREALKRWHLPLTFDEYYSLPHGQVPSKALDKAEENTPIIRTYWDDFIKTRGYEAELIDDCGKDELSKTEMNLIKEMFELYKEKNQYDMEAEHHDPDLFPEWEDPNGSRIETNYDKLIKILGYSAKELNEFAEDMKDMAFLESLA